MSARPPDPDNPVIASCARCGEVAELDQDWLCVACFDQAVEAAPAQPLKRPRSKAEVYARQRETYWQNPAKARARRRETYWHHRDRFNANRRAARARRRGTQSLDSLLTPPDINWGKGG